MESFIHFKHFSPQTVMLSLKFTYFKLQKLKFDQHYHPIKQPTSPAPSRKEIDFIGQ